MVGPYANISKLSNTTGLWWGQAGLWPCRSFSIGSLDGRAFCQQLRIILHHTPTARMTGPLALQVFFLLGLARALTIGPYANSSELPYTTWKNLYLKIITVWLSVPCGWKFVWPNVWIGISYGWTSVWVMSIRVNFRMGQWLNGWMSFLGLIGECLIGLGAILLNIKQWNYRK